jgi:hypothetical protein
MKNYSHDYKGPKAGISTQEEWVAVRDYDAFRYVRDGVWSYSDFDNYLYAMCADNYKKGENQVINALKEFHTMYNIKSD